MAQSEESALVVLVPAAEPLVATFRSQFDRSAIRGLPAHITVLYPFRHPDSLSSELLRDLQALFRGHRRFSFSLAGACGFPGVVYLAPQPVAPFDALMRDAASRFPDTPPYGGMFAHPVPHLTVAQDPPARCLLEVTSQFLRAAGAKLPLQCMADEVALAVKRAGRWSVGPRFPLA
ncbi:MAG: 2'-5' RNA ligase family protein [Deltaproteobacteria bacterium]|nr:2'-5' RNA ligase family protein [Deltaproteobacteria bacterium]